MLYLGWVTIAKHWLPTIKLCGLRRTIWRPLKALLGGLVCSLLWGLARIWFGYYLKHTPTWGILYGSLGSVMAALVFLYYSCAIFMLGAEVTAAFYRAAATGAFKVEKPSPGRRKA